MEQNERRSGGDQVRWWEWPVVVLALPLVFLRAAARWSEQQIRRFGRWLDHMLEPPAMWLGERIERAAEWMSRPWRWVAARLRRPVAWAIGKFVAFERWLARIPPRVWDLVEAVAHALINWAAPHLLIPWRQMARIAAALVDIWWRVADWASAPARLLWQRLRPFLVHAGRVASRGIRRCATLLVAPPRLLVHSLRGPAQAVARVTRRSRERLGASWRRVSQRVTAIRRRAAAQFDRARQRA